MSNWQQLINSSQHALVTLEKNIEHLTQMHDAATAEIAHYLRLVDAGIELDLDAIRATPTKPYTLFPINENEAWLVQWRGVKTPILGWVVSQEPSFTKSKVTRTMDLLTPLPRWMKDELGWKPPEHQAVIDGTRTSLRLTAGDDASFKHKYGKHLDKKQGDGSWKIKGGGAWIQLVAALVRDGILPYAPMPVAAENWDNSAKLPDVLWDIIEKKQHAAEDPYITRAISEFMEKGAVLVNYPPGSGKTLTSCAILNHFRGRVLLLADTTILIDQWRDRLQLFAPNANVTLSTYQGAGKYLNEEWDLIIFDEAQRLPANTFSKLAFVKTKYRLGLTGTAWREDDRQHLIVALSGFPVAIRWNQLIKAGVLRRPRIVVATVANDAAKTAYVKSLVAKRKGRTIIFCDWLIQGQALADALNVPFIHHDTPRKLQKLEENEVCVVSRIADRGISFTDLRLVIEVAGQGKAREQFAQRVGRILHGSFEGEFYTVFTPEEAAKYRGRVFGVEAELAGSVDIEFIDVGTVTAVTAAPRRIKKSRIVAATSIRATDINRVIAEPVDEISQTLQLTAVAAKVLQAERSLSAGGRAAPYVKRVLRYCWKASLSASEIAEALGLIDPATQGRIRTACNALVKFKLMTVDDDGRFQVDQTEIERLKALSTIRR